jgi:hypothetical protein
MGSFPSSEIQDVKCKEFEHCKVTCRDKPVCAPNTECRVEWKIGAGTKENVPVNNRVGVDGDGLYKSYLFHYYALYGGGFHRMQIKKWNTEHYGISI